MAQSRNITSLSGIDVVEFNHFPFVRRVEAEWQEDRSEIETCPECEVEDPKLHVKEWTERKLRDRPVGNKPLLIKLHCCRYECQECHCSFQPEHPGLRADSTLTQALFEHLCKRSVGTETHKEIARATGTHESTVRKCLRLQRRKMDARSNSTTPVAGALGVDKVHVGKGDALVVVASLLGHRKSVAEVLPDASEMSLKTYLDDMATEVPDRTVPIVIDMSTELRARIQASRLQTAIVVDRFHIVRRANLAVGSASKSLITDGLEERWERRKMELKGQNPQVGEQRDVLDVTEENHPVEIMEAAWKTAKRFQAIFDMHIYITRDEAKKRLVQWRQRIPDPLRSHFKKVTKPLENWREWILNYFDYSYTNAFNESVNRVAKRIDRRSKYSYETLRAKLVYSTPKSTLDVTAPASWDKFTRYPYDPPTEIGVAILEPLREMTLAAVPYQRRVPSGTITRSSGND